jgi:hypothetical protein
MTLANPSITSPRMGDRSRASRVSPRNITGRTYAQQHAEQEAKQAAEYVDLAAVRRAGFQAGFDAGTDAGSQNLTNALWELYRSEGMAAIEEFMRELDEVHGTAE